MKKQLCPNPFFKNLPPNLEGTDYYVGDVHGAFDTLIELLAAIGFDGTKDRLISVGDLNDRGPKSLECLALHFEPWFHAVIANHEEMMMHAYNNEASWYNWKVGESWIHPANGGQWGLQHWLAHMGNSLIDEDHYLARQIATEILPNLPLLLNVEQPDGRFIHVMHAELPIKANVNATTLQDEAALNRMFNQGLDTMQGTVSFLWGRKRFGQFYKAKIDADKLKSLKNMLVRNLENLGSSENLFISGHTIVQQPTFLDNFLNIDTGVMQGVAPYALTIYNSKTGAFHQNGINGINLDAQPLVINTKELVEEMKNATES